MVNDFMYGRFKEWKERMEDTGAQTGERLLKTYSL